MGYKIKWETWNDHKGLTEFMETRKGNLKVTFIVWVTVGWEVDPEMLGGIWYKRAPILLWLN
jgi:hypothetical protein